jgi:integrase
MSQVARHDMRHCYVGLLIVPGLNSVDLSKQMGHANPGITLSIYAHSLNRQASAEKAKAALGTPSHSARRASPVRGGRSSEEL